jgi:iron-siderophore transport system substrate-binding protein
VIVHKRTGWLTACVSACVLLLTACGGGGGAEPAAPSAAPPAEGGAFPVSIEHDLGTTEIPSQPQRVVSLGYTDQDPILALGVVPVAIREFTGGRPSATWPWAADRLGGQQPQVLNGTTIDPETIAALAPDLIVAISAGLTQDQYDQFSAIAPTIVQPKGDIPFGTPWQDATRVVGDALGRSTEADQLISDLEARFEEVRAANPQLAGKRAIAAAASTGTGTYFAYSDQDPRGRFLTELGMTIPPEITALAGQQFYADISLEQLSLLDQADAVAWIDITGGTPQAALSAQPGAQNLRVAAEDRVVTLDAEQATALSFSSVLSLPTLLDSLPRQFVTAVGG